MKFGHRPLINGPTKVSQIDLDASRAARRSVHDQVRLRGHLQRLLDIADDEPFLQLTEEPPGDRSTS